MHPHRYNIFMHLHYAELPINDGVKNVILLANYSYHACLQNVCNFALLYRYLKMYTKFEKL